MRPAEMIPGGARLSIPPASRCEVERLSRRAAAFQRRESAAVVNGVSRNLPAPIQVSLCPESPWSVVSENPGLRIWVIPLQADAAMLRLGLARLDLPGTTRMSVSGTGDSVSFGLELAGDDGVLWTPTLSGWNGSLEIRIPQEDLPPNAAEPSFELRWVLELFSSGPGDPVSSNHGYVDAIGVREEDFPNIVHLRNAIATFWFTLPSQDPERRPLWVSLQGTGSLVNNSQEDGTAYFLTSNHCFLAALGANEERTVRPGEYPSFEAFWNHTSANGSTVLEVSRAEELYRLPRSNGATLLTADMSNDFALLKLRNLPGGGCRVFLGWQAGPIEERELHRVSHPYGLPQTYSKHWRLLAEETLEGLDVTSSRVRASRPPSLFHYSVPLVGRVSPGSSGAPLVTRDLKIAGHLWGACRRIRDHLAVDGTFSYTYGKTRKWLDPGGQGQVSFASLQRGELPERLLRNSL